MPRAPTQVATAKRGRRAASSSPAPDRPPRAAATTAAPDPEEPREETILVRMYKGMLGDCFLIRVAEAGARPKHILIDCGILMGIDNAKQKMIEVAESIRDDTGGFVDVLVLTHEHYDHLSGFKLAEDVFARIEFGALWMAWTEDPDDKGPPKNPGDTTGEKLRQRIHDQRQTVALLGAARTVPDNPFAAAPEGAVRGLEAFIGEWEESRQDDEGGDESAGEDAAEAQAVLAAARTGGQKKLRNLVPVTRRILDHLVEKVGKDAVRYLEPGDVLEQGEDAPLRTYVLGPPRDEKLLFKDRPSGGEAKETYLATAKINERALLRMAGIPPEGDGEDADMVHSSPFSKRHWRLREAVVAPPPPPQAEQASAETPPPPEPAAPVQASAAEEPPLSQAEQDAVEWFRKHYYDPGRADRQIQYDWLRCGGALALKLDSDTNNTSLVLAFELGNRDVLLFAADAQVGNWLSWHKQDYFPAGDERVTASNLLERAVLYKVGHHGSHNATLKKEGLGKMTDPRLVAMLPTVEDDALRQGAKGWKMPADELYKELLKKTQGRILRSDSRNAEKGLDAKGTPLTSDKRFLSRVTDNDLYIEYRVSGPPLTDEQLMMARGERELA